MTQDEALDAAKQVYEDVHKETADGIDYHLSQVKALRAKRYDAWSTYLELVHRYREAGVSK